MEVHGKRALWSIIDTNPSFQTHQENTETNPDLNPKWPHSPYMKSPPTPNSPWTLSPHHLPPSPSFFYRCLASLHRQDGSILSLAVSRGLVYTGSSSNRIRIWKLPEFAEKGCLKTNSGNIKALLALGNILFITQDNKIRVWSVSASDHFQSKKLTTLPTFNLNPKNPFHLLFSSFKKHHQTHKNTITCLAYYYAEGLLYSGSLDKTVKVYKLGDKKCIDTFAAHEDSINAIVVNQQDGSVFTCSSDGSTKLWRRFSGETPHKLTMTLKFQTSSVNALALSCIDDKCVLYSGCSDGFINFWEKEAISGRFNHGGFLQGHRFSVLCLATLERLVFSGSEDTTIRVWMREKEGGFHGCLVVLEGHHGPVKCLAVCLEMEKLAMEVLVYSGSLDGTMKVWRVSVFNRERKVEEFERVGLERFDYEMSPVLSPSWVQKKLQASHLQ